MVSLTTLLTFRRFLDKIPKYLHLWAQRRNQPLVIGRDGRADIPGHSAEPSVDHAQQSTGSVTFF